MGVICSKHGTTNIGRWTSSSTGKAHFYCKTCRQLRAKNYTARVRNSSEQHTKREWLEKLKQFDRCPICKRKWGEIPQRPDKRYKNVWTKDHIKPLNRGGSNAISNIQPLCYRCNFSKR